MSVGCIEPQFYRTFLEKLGIGEDHLPQYEDFDELKVKVAEIFQKKTRNEWCEVFEGSDACVTPVLGIREAPSFPHNASRWNAKACPSSEPDPSNRAQLLKLEAV